MDEQYCHLYAYFANNDTPQGSIQAVVEHHYTAFAYYLPISQQETRYPAFVAYLEGIAIGRNEPFAGLLSYLRTDKFLHFMIDIERQFV